MQKIAFLSAAPAKGPCSDLKRLCCDFTPPRRQKYDVSTVPQSSITLTELDVLFALCQAAPLLDNAETADQLLKQLSPYLLEAHSQVIASSPFLRSIEPSPWQALTYNLTSAVLSIGIRHPTLHDAVFNCTSGYLRNCLQAVDATSAQRPVSEDHQRDYASEQTLEAAAVSVSLLGFLEAASIHANFYYASEHFHVVDLLRQILDENLMVSVEGVFSSIRTSESDSHNLASWKSYSKRYAASGQPLGAMLLQRAFIRLLVSCSSLLVTTEEKLRMVDTFDVLTSEEDFIIQECHDTSTALLELLSEIAIESMRLLEDGSDYLQLGSAWQQRLAFTVKAHTLHTFLNCMVVNEEFADIDMLMSWLEDSIADPIQMADDSLACVVLKSMAVIAKFSPASALTLSRSLPRFVVQGGIKGEIVDVAARSLTNILRLLSQDAVITGLYSLGNVLSVRSGTEKVLNGFEAANGNVLPAKNVGQYSQNSTGSAISLQLSGDEETEAAYGNIVRAIVGIAKRCKDDKITALAQSMLLQKLGRVNLTVDLHIIIETAKIATTGGLLEFKSLLKLYTRLGHDAVVRSNNSLREAVRFQKTHRETLG